MVIDLATALAQRVLQRIPDARREHEALRAQHRARGLGEPTPEAFLSAYSQQLISRFRPDETGRRPLVTFVELIEDDYGVTEELDVLLQECFLRHLPPEPTDPDPAGALGLTLGEAVGLAHRWRAHPDHQAFTEHLVSRVPVLADLLDGLTEWGDHEDVRLHGFLAGIAFWATRECADGRLDEVLQVLELVDDAFEPGPLENPIAVSFVELMPHPHEPGANLVEHLPPKLRAERARQQAWRAQFTGPPRTVER